MQCKNCDCQVTKPLENNTLDIASSGNVPDMLIREMIEYARRLQLSNTEFCSNACLNQHILREYKTFLLAQCKMEVLLKWDDLMIPLEGHPGLDKEKIKNNREFYLEFLDSRIEKFN